MSLFPIASMSVNPISDFNRIFNTLTDVSRPSYRVSTTPADSMTGQPCANVLEDTNGYSIELAVPGFSRGDFNIKVNEDVITVSMSSEDGPEYIARLKTREFDYASFTRSWSLPEGAIINEINARYESGILMISIPTEISAVRTVQIEVQ